MIKAGLVEDPPLRPAGDTDEPTSLISAQLAMAAAAAAAFAVGDSFLPPPDMMREESLITNDGLPRQRAVGISVPKRGLDHSPEPSDEKVVHAAAALESMRSFKISVPAPGAHGEKSMVRFL